VEYIETKKIKVIIAARQFLYRLGIKTIISVIGVEPELFETSNYESTKKCMLRNSGVGYLVLNEDIIPVPKQRYLNELGDLCPDCRLLLIGNDPIEDCPCANYALNIETQKEMVERFQEFFFEPEKSNNNDDDNLVQLSDREIDVLKAVATGYANKEIAEKLFISINTVITHRKNITDKLGVKTIAGLTVYAIMNNLISPEDVKG
jgi:DNA-binding CsgD family transcriptional regulator